MQKHAETDAHILWLHPSDCPVSSMSPVWCLSAVAGSAGSGTPDYMPMEQLSTFLLSLQHRVYLRPDHNQGLADVYSLGHSLWMMLAGQEPLARVLGYKHRHLDLKSLEARVLKLKLKQDLVSVA